MQKCNEASTAVINAIGLKDPCSGHLRATRQACPNPFDKHSFLLARQLSFAAALVKDHQPCEPVLFVQLMPAANRVVVQQQGRRHFRAAPAVVEQHHRVRAAHDPPLAAAIPRQRA